jgi:hypothetical protein
MAWRRSDADFDDDFIADIMEAASSPSCGPVLPEDGGKPIDFSIFDKLGEAGEALVAYIRQTGKRRATLTLSRRHLNLLLATIERICEARKIPLPRTISEFEAMIPEVFAELAASPKYETQGYR